jgi:hypothetical protein
MSPWPFRRHPERPPHTAAPEAGDRVVRITGRAKIDGLLGAEEAVRLQLVARARFGLWALPLKFEFIVTY